MCLLWKLLEVVLKQKKKRLCRNLTLFECKFLQGESVFMVKNLWNTKTTKSRGAVRERIVYNLMKVTL